MSGADSTSEDRKQKQEAKSPVRKIGSRLFTLERLPAYPELYPLVRSRWKYQFLETRLRKLPSWQR
jgi:hypothetical protein